MSNHRFIFLNDQLIHKDDLDLIWFKQRLSTLRILYWWIEINSTGGILEEDVWVLGGILKLFHCHSVSDILNTEIVKLSPQYCDPFQESIFYVYVLCKNLSSPHFFLILTTFSLISSLFPLNFLKPKLIGCDPPFVSLPKDQFPFLSKLKWYLWRRMIDSQSWVYHFWYHSDCRQSVWPGVGVVGEQD
jgi:hypothetical protein